MGEEILILTDFAALIKNEHLFGSSSITFPKLGLRQTMELLQTSIPHHLGTTPSLRAISKNEIIQFIKSLEFEQIFVPEAPFASDSDVDTPAAVIELTHAISDVILRSPLKSASPRKLLETTVGSQYSAESPHAQLNFRVRRSRLPFPSSVTDVDPDPSEVRRPSSELQRILCIKLDEIEWGTSPLTSSSTPRHL